MRERGGIYSAQGRSFYLRPSIGVGSDRPADGSVEVGYKIVGWLAVVAVGP
jgi:hypothetical protein